MTRVVKDRVALRAFFKIAKVWGLTDDEQLSILGQPDQATFDAWRHGEGPTLPRDTLERISYVLGIFQGINTLLPDKEIAAAWVRQPNDAPIFDGISALDRMTAGNVSDLLVVRQYLDAEAPPLKTSRDRLFGALEGKISIADDFDETPPDIIDVMEGR
ncbi:DUF2384 domain-containing protein [Qipengyuania sp. G39]|uniref:DUF2384 domain-containing protein n=1 Tax=Qipengyuania profundimaris TaxID=3067652 RepID=A0ABT9HLU0_9SPHN|nr:antitoxin Xre-like helix-turn-helix domain-containing protein [Qipengyuania sp. G39]MDP4574119.1 DUF2384 domain-containing protein [Qipengyuania sp. G39]